MDLDSPTSLTEAAIQVKEPIVPPPFWLKFVARLVWYPVGMVVPAFPILLLAIATLGPPGPADPRGAHPGFAILISFVITASVIGIPILLLTGSVCSYVLSRRELLLVPGLATIGWTLYVFAPYVAR